MRKIIFFLTENMAAGFLQSYMTMLCAKHIFKSDFFFLFLFCAQDTDFVTTPEEEASFAHIFWPFAYNSRSNIRGPVHSKFNNEKLPHVEKKTPPCLLN